LKNYKSKGFLNWFKLVAISIKMYFQCRHLHCILFDISSKLLFLDGPFHGKVYVHGRYLMFIPLWTQAINTYSLSITFLVLTYNINGMSLYNKYFGNEKCPHHILPLLGLRNIWHLPPHNPNYDGPSSCPKQDILKINVWINLLHYLSLNLIAWHKFVLWENFKSQQQKIVHGITLFLFSQKAHWTLEIVVCH
jgi:hypothetical protein